MRRLWSNVFFSKGRKRLGAFRLAKTSYALLGYYVVQECQSTVELALELKVGKFGK